MACLPSEGRYATAGRSEGRYATDMGIIRGDFRFTNGPNIRWTESSPIDVYRYHGGVRAWTRHFKAGERVP